MGVYPEGGLYEFDLSTEPGMNNPKRLAVLGNDQERLVDISSSKGKLYISTISGYGTLGGSLTVYDTVTGEINLHRNVVQNQSVLSTTVHDGKQCSAPPRFEADWVLSRRKRKRRFCLG